MEEHNMELTYKIKYDNNSWTELAEGCMREG
jgi:hypothetical protein